MQLTLFSDYSLRMLMYLGIRDDELVPIVDIAESYGISRHYMLKVANELVRLGYIEAVRGRKGGVRLAKPPAAIRVGDLVRATEPEGGVLDCVGDEDADCAIVAVCRLRSVFSRAQAAFYAVLDEHTVAELIEEPTALAEILQITPTARPMAGDPGS